MVRERLPDWPPGWVPPPSDDELVFDDGEPMESELHRDLMHFMIHLLRQLFLRRGAAAYVGGNQAVYYSETQVRNRDFRGPDVFVVLDVAPHRREGWVVWKEEGRAPDFVLELVSHSTAKVDRDTKMRIYERVLKVQEYFLYDPYTQELLGYQLTEQGYVAIAADDTGAIPSRVLGVKLATWAGPYDGREDIWVRLFSQEGALHKASWEAEAERAEAEAERAEVLERRLAEYEAKFGKLG